MSYENQAGGNSGLRSSVQNVGSDIAGHQGGLKYESKPGSSLSGGAAPERNTFSGISGSQEPGYEHVSAPTSGGSYTGGHIESSGGPTYQPSSLGQQGTGTGLNYGQNYGGSDSGIGSTATGGKPGGSTIGGAGINKDTVGYGSGSGSAGTTTGGIGGSSTNTGSLGTGSGTASAPTGGSGLQQTATNAQRTAEPYVAQAREAAAPYVAKAQEVGNAALENARPILNQAAEVAAQAGQVGKEKATQAYHAAANELDARGINLDTTQQKLAEVGQTMKDYGAVGQQRAGEYFQQAVDQAKTIGHDGENKSIVATIFGTVFLVWLAFGFSIGAVFALGVAGSIAAVLSRYSRAHGTSRVSNTSSQPFSQSTGQQPSSLSSGQKPFSQSTGQQPYSQTTGQQPYSQTTGQQPHSQSSGQQPSSLSSGHQPFSQSTGQQPYSQTSSQQPYSQGYTQQPASQTYGQQSTQGTGSGARGVETHYPRPAHPDNSLHTNIGQ